MNQASALRWALAASLLGHGLVLLIPQHEPAAGAARPARFEARLAAPAPVESPPAAALAARAPAASRPRLLTAKPARGPAVAASPKWSVAEKAEMNRFLDELGEQAKARPTPTLAQRSLAMAREQGRQLAQQDSEREATLERRPNSAEPDPFSLDLYVDGLVKRLNRSAAFVRNDPRSRGVQAAMVQFRLNPDGTLKSFVVLNAADQGDEIAFIKSVVERSAPFSPFPADLDRAARSLAMLICIKPATGGGFGFTRNANGRGC